MTGLLVVLAVVNAAARAEGVNMTDAAHHVELTAEALTAIVGDNEPMGDHHRQHYNGVFAITTPSLAESPFVPAYAGLNLEHYFDARGRHEDATVFFEPRHAPMELRRLDKNTVELYQAPTPFYGVESWTRFAVSTPHYIDMAYRCIPRKDDFTGGFMGMFWASYIHAPMNKSIYFLAAGSTLDTPRWVQYCTQAHGHASTVLREDDTFSPDFGENEGLLFKDFSPLRYSEPFYYGHVRDHVLLFIFERGPLVRFSHSPSGGGPTPAGDDTSPAWDFQLIVPDYEVGHEYGLRVRLVYKPWAGRDDVLDEVRKAYATVLSQESRSSRPG